MITTPKSFRLKREDNDYLISLVETNKFLNKTQALAYIINHFREDQGLRVQLPKRVNALAIDIYSKLFPFTFGSLATYFFVRQHLVFLLFTFVAIFPFIFKLEAVDEQALRVSL